MIQWINKYSSCYIYLIGYKTLNKSVIRLTLNVISETSYKIKAFQAQNSQQYIFEIFENW